MDRFRWVIVLCWCALPVLGGCGPPPTVLPSSAPTATASPARAAADWSGFAARLRDEGLAVERVAEVSQPFLRTVGALLRLGGGALAQPAELQISPYADPDPAADDAGRVQPDATARWTEPDGNVKTISFAWVAPPHFFRQDRVVVLYTGTDPAVLALLTDLLGPQFAGR